MESFRARVTTAWRKVAGDVYEIDVHRIVDGQYDSTVFQALGTVRVSGYFWLADVIDETPRILTANGWSITGDIECDEEGFTAAVEKDNGKDSV